MLGESSYKQRNAGKADADGCNTRPSKRLPKRAGKQRAKCPTHKISGHEDGIDAVCRTLVEHKGTSLVADLHKLHAYVDYNNADNITHVKILQQLMVVPYHW